MPETVIKAYRITSVLTFVHKCSTTILNKQFNPASQRSRNVPQVAETVTTSNELELLYNSMFSKLLNGNYHGCVKVFPLDMLLDYPDTPTVTPTENIIQAEQIKNMHNLDEMNLINIFQYTVEPKTKDIKEAMADSAWIESMLEELHQFDRLGMYGN
ncbi:hypothetical protein Tco_0761399 [Tanacetum coccineum]